LKSVFASDRDGRMVGMVQFLDYGDARLTCEARNIDEASRSGAARRAGRVSPWSWLGPEARQKRLRVEANWRDRSS